MQSNNQGFSRREVLAMAGSVAALTLAPGLRSATAAPPASAPASAPSAAETLEKLKTKRFKVAADDLFIGKRGTPGAVTTAKQCNLDGVAIDMGTMSGGTTYVNKLLDESVRKQYLDNSKTTGVEICSLSFFALYAWPFPTLPFALDATTQWVDLMDKMNVRRGHMPIMCPDFVLGKLTEPPADRLATDEQKAKWEKNQKDQPERYARTVEIFRKVAPAAEKAGVIMGVESNLDADGYIKFLDAVGSRAVQAVYNPGVGLENKFDVYADIEKLGKDRICMLHLEQGSVAPEKIEHRLGDGLIDFKKLRTSVMKINWAGWMPIARSRLANTSTKWVDNMTANGKYVHEIFPE